MSRDLTPSAVSRRLAWLAGSYQPMTASEARARPTPRRHERFEVAVARRLRELRALMELTNHLHGARWEREE